MNSALTELTEAIETLQVMIDSECLVVGYMRENGDDYEGCDRPLKALVAGQRALKLLVDGDES